MSDINNDDVNFKTIMLDYPIDMGDGKSLTSIRMSRRFKVGHLKLIPQDFIEYASERDIKEKKKRSSKIDLLKLIPLLAALCNVSEETFDKMDFNDLMKVSKEIESFFPNELYHQTGIK